MSDSKHGPLRLSPKGISCIKKQEWFIWTVDKILVVRNALAQTTSTTSIARIVETTASSFKTKQKAFSLKSLYFLLDIVFQAQCVAFRYNLLCSLFSYGLRRVTQRHKETCFTYAWNVSSFLIRARIIRRTSPSKSDYSIPLNMFVVLMLTN